MTDGRVELRFDPGSEHNLMLDVGRPFIVFNDDPDLPFDHVGGQDLHPISGVEGCEFFASCAWSSDCEWYFVVTPGGIALLNIDGSGWFCSKRSADFIRLFLEAPRGGGRGRG